ncbi:hypothetical protein Ptr902_03488 [Pyrenophora tritici-repentis]|nr:hypothetical protein Ptr902_03488 [Pyrenophora tritici-repentis]
MVHNLVRNEGVPALAYSVNDASALWPCFLKILYSDTQFVVSLEYSISIHGIHEKQPFTLRYEGDNLMLGKTSLRDIAIPLPEGSLDVIARQGQPQLRTLLLSLKAPCSVWFPHSLVNEVYSRHTSIAEFLTLARATEVRILFDIKWLGKSNLARLQSVVEGSRQPTGVPAIPQFACLYQQVDWSVIDSIQDAKSRACLSTEDEAVPSIEDALLDAPPSYAHVSGKRSRKARSSSTPDSPPPKRLLQDPTCAPSPLERANSTASSTATVQVDLFQDIVTSAIEKVLPDLLRAQLPSILQDILPGMLTGPSPSSSPTPRSTQIANTLTQHHRTTSHKPTPAAVVRAVLSTYTKTHLQELFTDAVEEASELHNSARNEFEDDLVDIRLEIATLKEDHIAAFNEECNEKLAELKERLAEDKEETEVAAKAYTDDIVLKTWDRLNMVEKGACCRCKCLDNTKNKQGKLGQGRRAMSLPL